jgi:hypothetical protein
VPGRQIGCMGVEDAVAFSAGPPALLRSPGKRARAGLGTAADSPGPALGACGSGGQSSASPCYYSAMQLIEVTDFGVRAAEIRLGRTETPLRFVLFPMVHVGSDAYYQEVTRRLQSCQLIVAEGISGSSAAASALTSVYRFTSRRMNLKTQQLDLSSLQVPIINPDFTGEQFDAGFARLPRLFRLMVFALFPIVGVYMALVGSRAALARYLETDDLPTREELATMTGNWERLDSLLRNKRDEPLLRCLDEIHQQRCSEDIDVAVVYGALHMRAVVEYLSARYGYFPRKADWITILSF